ncbi:MAG TPA: tetratricopeptide repeat protein [Phycisphaerales bacterium]|nr:tetratricopeptide repeat protein [Phycisphaerales bacterium]
MIDINRKFLLAGILTIALFLLFCVFSHCIAMSKPIDVPTTDFTGSASCIQCHEKFYKLWSSSFHGLAMQPYTNKFGAEEITAHDEFLQGETNSYRAFITKKKGYVVVRSGDEEKSYPITDVLGGKNVYYFLTLLERGRLQVLPLAYDVPGKEWFDTTASAVRHFTGSQDEAIDWMETPLTFNTSCFSCHVSQLKTNYDLKTDTYHTVWNEPGINCETCHGPSGEHVRSFQKAALDNKKPKDLGLVSTKNFDVEQVDGMCGPCHAKMRAVTAGYKPGEKYFDHYDLVTFENRDYYPDGRDLGENYTFTSWRMNKCAESGKLDCVYCHTSSGRDRFAGDKADQACLPCHDEIVNNVSAHSHHEPDSQGSKCKTCHMPKTEFARMVRHDHSFRPPTPKTTIAHKSPNACNICHTDKTAVWADKHVTAWYGDSYQDETVHFASLIDDARKGKWDRLDEMLKYITGKDRREVVATSLIRILKNCPDNKKLDTIIAALKDSSPMVRAAAASALSNHGTEKVLNALLTVTDDRWRVVRSQAGFAISTFPPQMISAENKIKSQKAIAEYLTSLQNRPDDALSYYNLGNYYSNQGDLEKAIDSYNTSTELRSDLLMSHVNASIIHARLGKTKEAEISLRKALVIDPNNAASNFNMGLLLAENGNIDGAKKCLAQALKTDPDFAEAAFNLGIILARTSPSEAIELCRRAHSLRPENSRYGYTLAFFLNQNARTSEAITVLVKMIDSSNATSDIYAFLAVIYRDQGRKNEALDICRKAIENEKLPMQDRYRFEAQLRSLQNPQPASQ